MSPARAATFFVAAISAALLFPAVPTVVIPVGPAAASASGGASVAAKPGAQRATVARIMIPTRARHRPGAARRVSSVLGTRSRWSGGPQHLLVLGRAQVEGRLWVKLRLPSRPNTSSAWVPANRVRLIRNRWRVRVSLDRQRVTVLRAGRKVISFRAVIGAPGTPTPKGLFALYERVRQPDPSGFLGPFALHLTAHSNVLDNYGGGPGRVAIHGRGPASLIDPLGSARSHG